MSRSLFSRLRRPLLVAGIAFVLVTSAGGAGSARAQTRSEPTQAERDTARDRTKEGFARRDRGDLAGALTAFAESDALVKTAASGLDLARAHLALGHLVETEDVLTRIMNEPPRPTDPPAAVRARKGAEALRAEVMVKTPLLSVTVENKKADAEMLVTVDGKALDSPAESHRINPGPHVIVARSGTRSVTEKVVIAEGEGKSAKLDFTNAVEDAPPTPQPTADVKTDTPVAPAAAKSGSAAHAGQASALPKVLFYGGLGLAVVGVGLGTGTGIVSLSHTDAAKKLCNGQGCPPTAHDDLSAARTMATVSTISFIAAGVGAGALAAGFILMRRESEAPKTGFVHPYVSPFGAGITGAF